MAMKKNRYVFHIFHKGDPSVGINDANTTVAVISDFEYDQDDLESFKESLADMFDVPVKHVLTEQEFLDEQKLEREFEGEMDRSEEEFRNLIDDEDTNYSFI